MSNKKETRWRQRFQNYEKAFSQLRDAMDKIDDLSDLEKEGLIQRFEYTFELAWKVIKDYIEAKGVETRFVRDVIKEAFHADIINNGELWLEMLEERNLMAHTYDRDNFNTALKHIQQGYYQELKLLHEFFKNE
jgi:nucleotidyltransferase substrate binding protein (TIGR01987 family)